MRRRPTTRELDQSIIECLEDHVFMTSTSLAAELLRRYLVHAGDYDNNAQESVDGAQYPGNSDNEDSLETDETIDSGNTAMSDEEAVLFFSKDHIIKRLRYLDEKKKKVKHQKSGYLIAKEWKESQPKAYIFITTEYPKPKKLGDQCHKRLVADIKAKFRARKFKNLTLTSAEIIMGHEFDIILIVYGDSVTDIGFFVLDFLQGHELVKKTHTVMVWPSEYIPPAEADPAPPTDAATPTS